MSTAQQNAQANLLAIQSEQQSFGIDCIIGEVTDAIFKMGYTQQWQLENSMYYDKGQLLYAAKILMKVNPHHTEAAPIEWDWGRWRNLLAKPLQERLAIAGGFIASQISMNQLIQNEKDGIGQ